MYVTVGKRESNHSYKGATSHAIPEHSSLLPESGNIFRDETASIIVRFQARDTSAD